MTEPVVLWAAIRLDKWKRKTTASPSLITSDLSSLSVRKLVANERLLITLLVTSRKAIRDATKGAICGGGTSDCVQSLNQSSQDHMSVALTTRPQVCSASKPASTSFRKGSGTRSRFRGGYLLASAELRGSKDAIEGGPKDAIEGVRY
ncbi:putative septum site-determining protein [Frankliniella fusca]|uniref:Septum site-determining protein n=1 Tax=Frankliniella fusca TaxID=407009 RepID=A0AAE1HKF7_9NEOP|nr:putative septum site-determining protein [Frankliniella fusca]